MTAERRYLVFVSSTYEDLIAERQAVVLAILRSRNMPSGMELAAEPNEHIRDVIYRWISDCDYYILVLGGRYGLIDGNSGMSYTELEYNYAKHINKPVIVLLLSEKYLEQKVATGLMGPDEVYERENPEALRAFRTRVATDYCMVVSDPATLEAQVLAALETVKLRSSRGGWVRAASMLEHVLDRYARYINYYLELAEAHTYLHQHLEELLRLLQDVVADAIAPDLGWIDVMVPVRPDEGDLPSLLIPDAEPSAVWLKVWLSGIPRSRQPTLIPTRVNNVPWRGSGNAFVARGLDYVSSFRGKFPASTYGLSRTQARRIERQYVIWRDQHYFASLLAVAIVAPDKNEEPPTPIGVLNLNFRAENPLGRNDVLPPDECFAIANVLEPAMNVLAAAIEQRFSG